MKLSNKLFLLLSFLFWSYNAYPQNDPPDRTINTVVSISDVESVRGEYGIWYKGDFCNSINALSHKNLLTKPFIICEGFDISADMDLNDIYSSMNNNGLFLDALRNDGYDIVILNLWDGSTDIEKNAQLFKHVIDNVMYEVELNHSKHGTFYYRPVVMGISMGGLIARYALAKTEKLGGDHKVEKLVCFDSPNKGANIPLGLQHLVGTFLGPELAIQEFRNNLPFYLRNRLDPIKLFEEFIAPNWKKSFDQKAALQMSANHIVNNVARWEFLHNMAEVGNYPHNCRLIGIANGASQTPQSDVQRGGYIFNWDGPRLCLIDKDFKRPFGLDDIHIRFCPLIISDKVWAMPGNDLGVVHQLSLGAQLGIEDNYFSYGPVNTNLQRDYLNASPIYDMNIDHVPGGMLSTSSFGLTGFRDAVNSLSLKVDLDYELDVLDPSGLLDGEVITLLKGEVEFGLGHADVAENFCFVPTLSALDISGDNWGRDLSLIGNYPHNRNLTPFDAIYWHSKNSDHAYMDEDNNFKMPSFLLEEVSPDNLYIQNRTFPAGYRNTFEARGFIAIGKNVDQVPGRTFEGPVIANSAADIVFSIGDGINTPANFVYFDDGFDSNGGNLEVVENNYNSGSCPKFLDMESSGYQPKGDWQTLRKSHLLAEDDLTDDVMYEGSLQNIEVSAYPNPFSHVNTIAYTIYKKGKVTLSLQNAMGGEITKLIDDKLMEAGKYEIEINGSTLENGLYFYNLHVNDIYKTFKVILQR